MCGIAGIITGKKSGLKERIESATGQLLHRADGPAQYYLNHEQGIALGHCRLSIIDLSDQGCQPLIFRDRYVIVHNGEVYNYIELKQELENKGYHFKTATDTEVLVAAYDAYKEDCLQKFEGMFSFAIWDKQANTLFAARDRFGEKPFYFSFLNDEFIFGSEMKALWKAGVERTVNQAMLYNYLTLGYMFNPYDPKETFYNNIFKLPIASYLFYNYNSKELSINQYWQLNSEIDNSISEVEAIKKFTSLLTDSIRRRLRSDVPIGTSLSGGLDSSSIVAIANNIKSGQYSHKAFTAVFPGYEKDESSYATSVAQQYGLEHYQVQVDPVDLPDMVEKLFYFHEVPFSSASAIAQYKVYESAKNNGVTVLLDGQGADEILGGYHKYYKWYWQELYKTRKLGKSKELENARAMGIREPFNSRNKIAALWPDFTSAMYQSRKAKQAAKRKDLSKDFVQQHKDNFYYTLPSQLDLNGALYFNTMQYGLEELLHLADRNSMAHATEVRLPYLDHNLVSFLFSLPPHFKIHNGWTKWLLRKSLDQLLPGSIVWRKDKVGFEPPQKQWMENNEVKAAIQEGKKRLVDNQILDASVLSKKIEPHDTHAARNQDWKFWTASLLFK